MYNIDIANACMRKVYDNITHMVHVYTYAHVHVHVRVYVTTTNCVVHVAIKKVRNKVHAHMKWPGFHTEEVPWDIHPRVSLSTCKKLYLCFCRLVVTIQPHHNFVEKPNTSGGDNF